MKQICAEIFVTHLQRGSFRLNYVMLCYVMLCYVMLCYVVILRYIKTLLGQMLHIDKFQNYTFIRLSNFFRWKNLMEISGKLFL